MSICQSLDIDRDICHVMFRTGVLVVTVSPEVRPTQMSHSSPGKQNSRESYGCEICKSQCVYLYMCQELTTLYKTHWLQVLCALYTCTYIYIYIFVYMVVARDQLTPNSRHADVIQCL